MSRDTRTRFVDCDAGRCMGCETFCCRMLVRLDPDEMEPTADGLPAKGFIDKDPEGYCIYFNRESGLCDNWENRPRVCREYDCNSDFMLQVVLIEGFANIAELAKASTQAYIPKECYRYVPTLDNPEED